MLSDMIKTGCSWPSRYKLYLLRLMLNVTYIFVANIVNLYIMSGTESAPTFRADTRLKFIYGRAAPRRHVPKSVSSERRADGTGQAGILIVLSRSLGSFFGPAPQLSIGFLSFQTEKNLTVLRILEGTEGSIISFL